jgi:hypothetical protein
MLFIYASRVMFVLEKIDFIPYVVFHLYCVSSV